MSFLTSERTIDSYTEKLQQLFVELSALRNDIDYAAHEILKKYRHYYPSGDFNESAVNLVNYLSMRQYDLRDIQEKLSQLGLSSLGRAEATVLDSFDAIIRLLAKATGALPLPYELLQDHRTGAQRLQKNTEALFGAFFEHNTTHVMVTMSPDTAFNFRLVKAMLDKGMTCARINCAHDDEAVWQKIISNIRRAEHETGRSCRILIDLAGHKIRTGPIVLEPPIYHLKCKKDRNGTVVASGYLMLSADPDKTQDNSNLFRVPISFELHKNLAPGASLELIDAQHKRRFLKIEKALSMHDWLASCDKDAYIASGCEVVLQKSSGENSKKPQSIFNLGHFAGEPVKIKLEKGDSLLLTDASTLGRPAEYSSSGVLIRPAHIGCTLSSAMSKLSPGQSVWIDDGKIGAVVESISPQGALLKITSAKPGGTRLHSDRGINFPETELDLPALSQKDLNDLDFVCRHADLVGFSFVETLADMEWMMSELENRHSSHLPVIVKIETDRAVKNLPDILLGSLGRHKLGVMIARGDLAVEIGNSRLAEIQEELLWICEAAHVPVIWATQVLESLTKKGKASRPEFTDAAMAARAECVMLNKGPYLLEAIEALITLIHRMQEHQRKKFSRLRALHWWFV